MSINSATAASGSQNYVSEQNEKEIAHLKGIEQIIQSLKEKSFTAFCLLLAKAKNSQMNLLNTGKHVEALKKQGLIDASGKIDEKVKTVMLRHFLRKVPTHFTLTDANDDATTAQILKKWAHENPEVIIDATNNDAASSVNNAAFTKVRPITSWAHEFIRYQSVQNDDDSDDESAINKSGNAAEENNAVTQKKDQSKVLVPLVAGTDHYAACHMLELPLNSQVTVEFADEENLIVKLIFFEGKALNPSIIYIDVKQALEENNYLTSPYVPRKRTREEVLSMVVSQAFPDVNSLQGGILYNDVDGLIAALYTYENDAKEKDAGLIISNAQGDGFEDIKGLSRACNTNTYGPKVGQPMISTDDFKGCSKEYGEFRVNNGLCIQSVSQICTITFKYFTINLAGYGLGANQTGSEPVLNGRKAVVIPKDEINTTITDLCRVVIFELNNPELCNLPLTLAHMIFTYLRPQITFAATQAALK